MLFNKLCSFFQAGLINAVTDSPVIAQDEKGNFKVEIKPVVGDGNLFMNLSTEAYKGEVYYTMDGTDPSVQSKKYSEPLLIDASLTLKAISAVNAKNMSVIHARQSFVMHKAVGKNVGYANPVSRYYIADGPNSLTDGVRGTHTVGKYWHGFSGKDLIATIDLGKRKIFTLFLWAVCKTIATGS